MAPSSRARWRVTPSLDWSREPQGRFLNGLLATNRDLGSAVTRGEFRSDLYYRVTQSVIGLLPLRERREEIPWLVQLAVEGVAPGLRLDVELVEACTLRHWPGNVRELLGEVRRIARIAEAQSCLTIPLDLLVPHVGDAPPETAQPRRSSVTAGQIERALREAPNVSAAAKRLGIHRSHLHRLIRQLGIDRGVPSSSDS